MLDLIALHHAFLGQDFFQQRAELRDVPLSVAQRIKQPALGVLGADLEDRIERPVRRDHAQILVQHENRLAHGVDNALGERQRVRDDGELFSKAGCVHDSPAMFAPSQEPARSGLPTLRLLHAQDCAELLTLGSSRACLMRSGRFDLRLIVQDRVQQ